MAVTQAIVQAPNHPIFHLPDRRRSSHTSLGRLGAGILRIMGVIVPQVRDDDSMALRVASTRAQWVLNTRLIAVLLLSSISQTITTEVWSAQWATQMILAGCNVLALLNGYRLYSSTITIHGSTLQRDLLVYKRLVFSLAVVQVAYLGAYLCIIAFHALF